MTSLTKICLHWTGGANMPCEQNLDCYHFLFDKSGKLKDFQMMSIIKKEDGSFNAPIPLKDEKGKVVKFSVDEYLKFENEVAQANDSMIRPYVKQSKKTEGNTNSNSMDLQR